MLGWRPHCPYHPDPQSYPDKINILNSTREDGLNNNYQVLEGLWRFQSVDEGLASPRPGAGRVSTAQTNEIIGVESDWLPSLHSGLIDEGSLARLLVHQTPADRLPVLLTAAPEEDRVLSGDLVAPADLVVLLTPAQLHLMMDTVSVDTRKFQSELTSDLPVWRIYGGSHQGTLSRDQHSSGLVMVKVCW